MDIQHEINKIPSRVDRGINFLLRSYGPDALENITPEDVEKQFDDFDYQIIRAVDPDSFEDEDWPEQTRPEFLSTRYGFDTPPAPKEAFEEYKEALKDCWLKELDKNKQAQKFSIF